MAMTLRLNAAENQALEMLAASQGVSKQQAAKAAIMETARRHARAARISEIVTRVQARDGGLLDRLAR